MNNEKAKSFLESLLSTQLDSEVFVDQINLFSRYLVYTNPGYYYNETYLPNFCSEFIKFQNFVKNKNSIFEGIKNKIHPLSKDLNLRYVMDQFLEYSFKDDDLKINPPIDLIQICTNKVTIKGLLDYEDREHLFLRTYSVDIENKVLQQEVIKKVSDELMKWIEDICNGKRK